MANGGEHGQHGFNDHALIVIEGLSDLKIGWIAIFGVEAMIGKITVRSANRAVKG